MPDPTYSTETIAEAERLVCLIPDASKPDGRCGWYSAPLSRGDAVEGMTQHLQQMHGAAMIEKPSAAAESSPPPPEAEEQPA